MSVFCLGLNPLSPFSLPNQHLPTRTSRMSTASDRSGSLTASTASTAMGASREACWETTLEESDVAAARASAVRSSASTGAPNPSTAARAATAAAANPSEMAVGCMPRRSSLAAAARRAPATTVTVVVPSPAAASCALASSTSILAAGWDTAMVLRMVAPSLVMMTSPLGWVT